MSTDYCLVCKKHKEFTEAFTNSCGSLKPWGLLGTLIHFLDKHLKCQLITEDRQNIDTDEGFKEFTKPTGGDYPDKFAQRT